MANIEDIKKHAGQMNFGSAPKMPFYPYLRINGNEGTFTLNEKNGDKFEQHQIGTDLSVIMLRVRRRLQNFSSGMSTTEHNYGGDKVVLFLTDPESKRTIKIDEGLASEIREKHPELGTEQVVYSLYEGQLVRLTVKGGSLGSDNEPQGSTSFYDYLQTFKGEDHVWMYHTKLSAIEKVNKKLRKKYFAINFERSDKVDELELDVVAENMTTLFNLINVQDEYYGNVKGKRIDAAQQPVKKELAEEETIPVIDLEEGDEIKPEEIPF